MLNSSDLKKLLKKKAYFGDFLFGNNDLFIRLILIVQWQQ